MSEFFPVYLYLGLVFIVTLTVIAFTGLFPSKKGGKAKFMPYESGIQTETHLFQKPFPLRHYLVGLIFLVFDIQVILLFPWAATAKTIGPFAFYEMFFFLAALIVGFIYVWRKGGLQWE